jgi:hypothetical protein
LEVSIRKFFVFYEEFVQNKTQLESDVFNHFQELRFQIDEHREKLKEKIDVIALKMIDETKMCEAFYLNNLKDNFSSFDGCKSLDTQCNEIEDTFRDPNLLIQTIQEMQPKQEESLNEIQLKLNEMTKIKDDLKATNLFQPNLYSFNQDEESFLFGSIKLNTNPFKSEILNGERQMSELIDLCEFSPNDKWSLLYRGSRDGFQGKDFHWKCDGHANTLTIVKAKESSYIFGGFTTVHWESSTSGKWKSDPNAFIFSLTNKDNKPVKMKIIDPNKHQSAIRCHFEYGAHFVYGFCIANNANTTTDGYSNLGLTYSHPQYAYETNEAKTFFDWIALFSIG